LVSDDGTVAEVAVLVEGLRNGRPPETFAGQGELDAPVVPDEVLQQEVLDIPFARPKKVEEVRVASQNVAERTLSTEVVPTDALESQVETGCNLPVANPVPD